MRYQAKSQKSQSFVFNKENKENTDISNLHHYKLKKDSLPPKLEKKNSQSTAISMMDRKIDLNTDLKVAYSKLIADDYSQDILGHLISRAQPLRGFLENHTITSALRSKMVDWMIEVLSSYKMTEETFFRSVGMMDTFLLNCNKKQELKDLHLIGLTAMFIGSKYQEIHPLKLSVMYDKIARKKFTKFDILEKQSQMINSMGFSLEQVHLYDFVKHILHQIDFGTEKASKRYLQQIALYLAKMSLFNSQLVEEELNLLAGAVIFISLKTLEQTDKSVDPERHLTIMAFYLKLDEEKMIETSRKVLQLAKNFSKIYPSLSNLKRFNKFEYHQE